MSGRVRTYNADIIYLFYLIFECFARVFEDFFVIRKNFFKIFIEKIIEFVLTF